MGCYVIMVETILFLPFNSPLLPGRDRKLFWWGGPAFRCCQSSYVRRFARRFKGDALQSMHTVFKALKQPAISVGIEVS